ncbi:hypothetical protein [Streptomyces sp. NBC_01207]|uniref:hypothetical protein n=1 Tax=Streptomyces sp. NBC_01207 TaxID=2903772 RepID=UPI002E143978|nr:hypothetical protein OG457_42435 [Streptomyces sp. NBC_01207]
MRPSTPGPAVTSTGPAAYAPGAAAPVLPTSAPATTVDPTGTSAGAGRMQVLDRNWRVCGQSPSPGTHDVTTRVTFDTVKIEEACP